MKIKVYFGMTIARNSGRFSTWSVDCVSLDRSVVTKRLNRLSDNYHTEIKVRTLDTDNLEVIKYLK